MDSLQQRVETWIRDQRARILNLNVTWPPQWRMAVKWPWANGREHRIRIQQEYERKKKQLHNLCGAVKAESVSDLQDILCCMVLSECVYKVHLYIYFNAFLFFNCVGEFVNEVKLDCPFGFRDLS